MLSFKLPADFPNLFSPVLLWQVKLALLRFPSLQLSFSHLSLCRRLGVGWGAVGGGEEVKIKKEKKNGKG